VNIRTIVETALLDNASAVMLAHNHPSGVALPSKADNAMTVSARDALETVSIALVDHIIVADSDYVSLAANGLLGEKGL
jgi:DNA repair protein RadC